MSGTTRFMNSQPSIFIANAKINIGLQITGKRPDGYHLISSFFLEVDLHDRLHISTTDDSKITFTSGGLNIPGSDLNICVRAAQLLQREAALSVGANIHLEKNIPIGAGLGGGSSDAATTLKTLNTMWDLNLSNQTLSSLALELGADVPFFLRGGLQLAAGIGEQLIPIDQNPLQEYCILLITPNLHIPTQWAYQQLKKALISSGNSYNFNILSSPINWQLFDNVFERVIVSAYPEVGQIKLQLKSAGAIWSSLSGSGSTMFGIFDDREQARSARQLFSTCLTHLVQPVKQTV